MISKVSLPRTFSSLIVSNIEQKGAIDSLWNKKSSFIMFMYIVCFIPYPSRAPIFSAISTLVK